MERRENRGFASVRLATDGKQYELLRRIHTQLPRHVESHLQPEDSNKAHIAFLNQNTELEHVGNQDERWIVQGERVKIVHVADWAVEKGWYQAASRDEPSFLGKIFVSVR